MNRSYELIKNLARKAMYKFTVGNPQFFKYSVGRLTYGKPTVLRWGSKGTLKIGNFCSIGTGVVIMLDGNHRTDWITTYPFGSVLSEFKDCPDSSISKCGVEIGNDVWIGMNVLILPGVKVGDGAVIGAESVVTKDVLPYTIVAGNPAKIIRQRFDNEIIAKLLEIKWWNWSMERIRANMAFLLSNNLEEFVNSQ